MKTLQIIAALLLAVADRGLGYNNNVFHVGMPSSRFHAGTGKQSTFSCHVKSTSPVVGTKLHSFDWKSYYDVDSSEDTAAYTMQQTMVRVKDPQVSLDFYIKTLGFHLVWGKDFPQWNFSVYFVAYCDKASIPVDEDERWKFCMNTPGCVELTWNHGSETERGNDDGNDDSDSGGRIYNTGNSDATGTSDGSKVRGGFGHLGITVPDVYVACERFHRLGVKFHKSPNAGGMKGLAFVKDPDGYLIEVLPQGPMITKEVDCLGVSLGDSGGYIDNSK